MAEQEQAHVEETVETPEPAAGTDNTAATQETEQDKALQAAIDRAVTKALQTQEKRLKREAEQAIEAEKKSLQEKHLLEQGKFQELAEQRAAELAALKAEAAIKDLQARTANMLAERKLSSLTPLFDADLSTMEGRTEAAELLERIIDEAAEERVTSRLKTPRAPTGGNGRNVQSGTLAEQLLTAQRNNDWNRVAQLNDLIMEARHKALAK